MGTEPGGLLLGVMDFKAGHTEFILGIVGIIGGELSDTGKSAMSGNGLAVLTKNFYDFFTQAHPDFLADVDVGDRVEVFLHLDMAVGMDFSRAPLAHLEESGRQGL